VQNVLINEERLYDAPYTTIGTEWRLKTESAKKCGMKYMFSCKRWNLPLFTMPCERRMQNAPKSAKKVLKKKLLRQGIVPLRVIR
jgi:hypothetical protein